MKKNTIRNPKKSHFRQKIERKKYKHFLMKMMILQRRGHPVKKKFQKCSRGLIKKKQSGTMNRDSGGVSTGVPTPRRNTASNIGNFNAGPRNKSNTNNNNLGSNAKNKGIQCRECKGFGHIQDECAKR